jgi:type I restriction enzyme S subunit
MITKAYPRYKASGVDWLGEVPEGWEVKRTRFMVKMNPSKTEIAHIPPETEVSFLPMEAVSEDGILDLDTTRPIAEVSTGYTYFSEGDVTFAKITPCFENGKGAIMRKLISNYGFGTTELSVIRPGKGVNNEFLYYVTISREFRKNGEAWMYGAGGQKRVPDDFVRDFHFCWPPLPEQLAITSFLDRETGRIDTLIGKKQRLVELLKEKRTAMISRAVTKGLDPKVKMKPSGVEWLGEVPEGWEVRRLKYVVSLKSGDGITVEDIEDESEYPVYGGNGFRGYTNKYTHEGDYVLIGRQGALCGNINYAKGKFWASEHAVVATPCKPVATFWLGELLRIMNFNQYSISAAQPGLSIDRIKELFLPLPPLPEQQAIASFLDRETAKLDALVSKVESAILTLKEYRTAIISAAVTGKIDISTAINTGVRGAS